ncbi:hypothetical protein ACHAWF_011966 [Thalassiosira exigua]
MFRLAKAPRNNVISSLSPKLWGTSTLRVNRRPGIFLFSTAVAKPKSVVPKQLTKWKWKIVARVAFYLRIPFLVLSVYGIGYQQGIMDYSREPEHMESQMFNTVLTGVGCSSREDQEKVLIAREGEWRHMLSKFRADHRLRRAQDEESYSEKHRRMVMLQNATVVGEKLVKVAQAHVKARLMDVVKQATSQMPPEILEDNEKVYEALLTLEEVQQWTKAEKHMEGAWRFVLIPSPIPNAFVSEILPNRIFITTSFFEQFIESQDELALVLGHEISHLVLGHSSQANSLQAAIRTLEILLLSLDPTDGLLSLSFMGLLASARNVINAAYSRENEREADELGIKFAAMACYDTHAASKVFYKMHLQDVESGRESSSTKVGWGGLFSFFDSHPPTEERFRALLEESKKENKEKYEHTSCVNLKKIFWDAMKE